MPDNTTELPWYSRPMAVDANCFPFVRAELDELVAIHCPPLLLEDAVGLMVFGLSKRLIVTLAPRGVPLVNAFRANCEGAALEIVAYSHPKLLRRAGIVRVIAPPPRLGSLLVPWWKGWCSRMPTPMSHATALDGRQACILRIATSIMKEILHPNILQGVKRGVEAHRREHGKPERDPDDDLRSFAAEFWAMPPSEEKESNCYVVGKDGKIHINPRYVRDKLGRPHRRKVVGKAPIPPPADRFDDTKMGSHSVHFPKERPLQAVDGEALEDALGALRALDLLSAQGGAIGAAVDAEVSSDVQSVVEELRSAARSSLDDLLLERAEDLLEGRTTPTNLAREAGIPERTARNAWERIIAQMAAHPRLKAWDRSA